MGAGNPALAVELHELVRDEDVGHVGAVLFALHEPPAHAGGRLDLVDGRVQHVAEHRVRLAERVDERPRAVDGARRVKGVLRRVGAARGLVGLEVAEARALRAQAPRARGVGDGLRRRWPGEVAMNGVCVVV